MTSESTQPAAPSTEAVAPVVPVPAVPTEDAAPPRRPAWWSGPPFAASPGFQRWGLLALLMVFLAMAMEHLHGDLWMDEIITLFDYGQQGHWSNILRTYPVANNHMVYSVVLWFWLRLVPLVSEDLLRFPCLVFAVAAILHLHFHGRRLFGAAPAFLLAVMWAFSPLFLGFACQLRGYGLTMLLALVATTGALYLVRGDHTRGLFLFALPATLLPCVIPTNVLVNASLWLYVAIAWWQQGWVRQRVSALVILGVTVPAGLLLYVPILPKFMKVMGETAGWPHGSWVAGHWLQALGAHAGFFLLAVWILRRHHAAPATLPPPPAPPLSERGRGTAETDEQRTWRLQCSLPILALCCLVPLLGIALVAAPFPRVFLGYLAPLTCCMLIGTRPGLWRDNRHYALLLFFLLANALVAFQMTDYTMRRRLLAGEMPQNLLQQYYARNRDVSITMRYLRASAIVTPQTRIFADFHYFHSAQLNWDRYGGARGQVECLSGGTQFALQTPRELLPFVPQLVLGYHAERARQTYRHTTGYDVVLEPLPSPTPLTIYAIVALRDPERPLVPFEPLPDDASPGSAPDAVPIHYQPVAP